jgi:hypothetical protein
VPRVRPAIVVLLAGLAALGVVIAVSSGWRGLFVYGFFVGLAALFAFGAGLAGSFLTGASRGRFDRHDRH